MTGATSDQASKTKASIEPLAIEPFDKEWGVGVSGLTENPSPFPRINRMLHWVKTIDSTADSRRALIVTEGYEKYAGYPQNIKWAMILRDVLQQVDVSIWPGELIVGELAAPPNSAPIYPNSRWTGSPMNWSTCPWRNERTTVT